MLSPRHVLVAALVVSCQETPPLYPASAPADIREACAIAERKCTACHERDRIVYARHTVTEWRTTVDRMRRFPGSQITPADTEVILRCVSFNADSAALPAPPRRWASYESSSR